MVWNLVQTKTGYSALLPKFPTILPLFPRPQLTFQGKNCQMWTSFLSHCIYTTYETQAVHYCGIRTGRNAFQQHLYVSYIRYVSCMLWGHICQHSRAKKCNAWQQSMKYGKIGGLWVGGGAESSGSSGTEWNREKGEKQRKNKGKIAISLQYPLPMVHVPMD